MARGFVDAIVAGDLAEIEDLLSRDPTLANVKSEDGTSAVLLAAYNMQAEIAAFLAARAETLDIYEAAAVGDLERVRKLIQRYPVLVNAYAADGFQPLGLASFFGHLEVVELLLSHDADANSPSKNNLRVTPLHSAVAHRHLEIARLLIAQGADVNAPQQNGFTPLQGAVLNGQEQMVELLVQHGADPGLPGAGGRTPREEAEAVDQRGVRTLLIE